VKLKSTLVTVTAILAVGAGMAGLRAQEPTGEAFRVGLVDLYTLETDAPQFASARAAIGKLEADRAAVLRAGAAYTMLTPEEFDRAAELERTPPEERTAAQSEELRRLRDTDAERANRLQALLQLPEAERTPQGVTEFDELQAMQDACWKHQATRKNELTREMDRQLSVHEETATRALDEVLQEIAAEQGLDMIVQPRIRTVGQRLDTGEPLVEYHRVVHYGGVDITADVVAKLTARYSAAGALAAGE